MANYDLLIGILKVQRFKTSSRRAENPHLPISIIIAELKMAALSSFLENQFTSNELKNAFLDLFCKAQRAYTGFNKLASEWRLKRTPVRVTTDLSLNPLDPNNPTTYKVIHSGSAYLFSLNDLINIIETAICNAPGFFIEPLWPRNPYNNCPFTMAMLCNLYFYMVSIFRRPISTLFHLYFKEGFSSKRLVCNHESLLRDISLHS